MIRKVNIFTTSRKTKIVLTSLLLFGLTTIIAFASSHTYSYSDSFVSLSAHTFPQFGGPGEDSRHEGKTQGSINGGGNLAYLRTHVYSRDEADPNGQSTVCHLRNTDSGPVYNVPELPEHTEWRSVNTCTGQTYHEYRGLSIHSFGDNYSVQTDDDW